MCILDETNANVSVDMEEGLYWSVCLRSAKDISKTRRALDSSESTELAFRLRYFVTSFLDK
jgi:hypothetical protein